MSGCGSPWNRLSLSFFSFFFNDTATTEIYTLSLHDALPICGPVEVGGDGAAQRLPVATACRSEEHTSELQSRLHLVCRLLLEKKKYYNKCLAKGRFRSAVRTHCTTTRCS